MQVVYERCCGLDGQTRPVVAWVLLTQADGSVQGQVRTFSTLTAEVLALADWLEAQEVRTVALESTSVYWRPVVTVLEAGRTSMLVNAQHMQAVPGRKTAVKDSQWSADLRRHGLLTARFIPPKPIRDLRELTRYRKTLAQARAKAGEPGAEAAGGGQ